jgi:hypothetical protein
MSAGPPSNELKRVSTVLQVSSVVAAAGMGAYALYESSFPFMSLDALALLFWTTIPVGMLWGVAAIVAAFAKDTRLVPLAPLIAALVIAIAVSTLPKVVRVAVSESGLNETMSKFVRGELYLPDLNVYGEDEPYMWAGGVPIYGVAVIWQTPHLIAGHTGSDSPAGLVRFPDGPPAEPPPGTSVLDYPPRYQRLYGDWYLWD